MKSVSTRLNECVNKGESQHGDLGISVIDKSDGEHRALPWPREMT
jgi:alpha-acetolactate decarboxylase